MLRCIVCWIFFFSHTWLTYYFLVKLPENSYLKSTKYARLGQAGMSSEVTKTSSKSVQMPQNLKIKPFY